MLSILSYNRDMVQSKGKRHGATHWVRPIGSAIGSENTSLVLLMLRFKVVKRISSASMWGRQLVFAWYFVKF